MARRLAKELKDFEADPPEGCTANPVGENLFEWRASITGPAESPYKDGIFDLTFKFPAEYPMRPPEVKFTTKVYHPNVKDDGSVCVDILKDAWSPALSIGKVLLSMQQLLQEPNTETPLVPEIAEQYRSNRAAFNKTAADWTAKYAKA